MKRLLFIISFFIISALVLPITVFFIVNMKDTPKEKKKEEKLQSDKISVYFTDEKTTRTLPLEEYISCVVMAEMPASFELEALKAQAVAARSYALNRQNINSPDHPDAAVCTDSTHCKAYKSLSAAKKDWGKNYDKYIKKIETAVNETKGEILTYDGEIALTVFHSQAGGGRTENSSDVWGGNFPYLVSVESFGEENAPNFYSNLEIPFSEFKEKIETENALAVVNSPGDVGSPVRTDGGSVKSILIGQQSFSGSDIRKIFSLRSSCFDITFNGDTVRFDVSGYGHGVGMSQYGANAMASQGYNYQQILLHYYSGTKIESV